MLSTVAMLGSELERTIGRRTGVGEALGRRTSVGDASLSSYRLCVFISPSLSGDDA